MNSIKLVDSPPLPDTRPTAPSPFQRFQGGPPPAINEWDGLALMEDTNHDPALGSNHQAGDMWLCPVGNPCVCMATFVELVNGVVATSGGEVKEGLLSSPCRGEVLYPVGNNCVCVARR